MPRATEPPAKPRTKAKAKPKTPARRAKSATWAAPGVAVEPSPRRGGPTKYRPEVCEQVIAMMAEGASRADVAGVIGISKQSWYNWLDSHPEFAAAVEEGVWLCQGWWERKGRVGLHDATFNHVLWFMQMKNRFAADWKDRHDIAASHKLSLGDLLEASMEAAVERDSKPATG